MLQAIGLLDDLDKELNTYAMRLREWYGWHFPELGKIVPDHQMYAKALMKMGVRTQCKSLDFSDILPEEVEVEMKDAAEISMGTEVSEDDIANILQLCDQVVSLSEYRAQLWDYLRNRMQVHPHPAALIGQPLEANPRPTHAHARTPHATPSHTRAMTRYMQWESLLCTLTRHLLWFLEPAATRTTCTHHLMHTSHPRRIHVACTPHMHTAYTPYMHRQAIAPNLTTVVGELVGARLIAHAGSLMNLAKQPASTVQILGAEKARPPARTAQPAPHRPLADGPETRLLHPTPPHATRHLTHSPGDDEIYAKIFSPIHPDETPAVVFGARPPPLAPPPHRAPAPPLFPATFRERTFAQDANPNPLPGQALFRALKTKHDTPKYGLIYHASLVGQAEPKHKGKISRVLAAKCALSIRVDALGETSEPTVGYEGRLKVEERLRQLQGKAPIPKEEVKLAVKQPKVAMAADAKVGGYSTAGDAVLDGKKAKKEKKEKAEAGDDEAAKKAAKKAKKAAAAAAGETGDAEASEKKKKKRDKDDDEEKPKKKKKSKE